MAVDVKFKFRRGPSYDWETRNPVLASGEPGLEIDTERFKLGDGRTPWNDLEPYYIDAEEVALLVTMAISELPPGGGGLDPRMGNLADLTTSIKTTLVAAINEVNTPAVRLTTLYTNAKAG